MAHNKLNKTIKSLTATRFSTEGIAVFSINVVWMTSLIFTGCCCCATDAVLPRGGVAIFVILASTKKAKK